MRGRLLVMVIATVIVCSCRDRHRPTCRDLQPGIGRPEVEARFGRAADCSTSMNRTRVLFFLDPMFDRNDPCGTVKPRHEKQHDLPWVYSACAVVIGPDDRVRARVHIGEDAVATLARLPPEIFE